jgi:hypothetical protein
MAFFFTDNPIALFAALVLAVVVLKIFLGRHKWFEGSNASYITPILIIVIILCLAYRPLLSILSLGVPLFILLVLALFAIGAMLFTFGMPQSSIWPALKSVGPLKLTVRIIIICIIAFAVSQSFGDRLLEEPSFSIADAMTAEQEPVEVDFAPLFTRQALGLVVLLGVLGLAFVFVNLSS